MMSPAGFEHGRVVIRVTLPLANYLSRHPLGVLTGAETGFQIASQPDTVRAPDVAFIRAERVPPTSLRGFFPGAPDLAVEVLSPDDRTANVLEKTHEWLEAGCRAVWIVDPQKRTVTVHHSHTNMVSLTEADILTGGDLLPGFAVAVVEFFAG